MYTSGMPCRIRVLEEANVLPQIIMTIIPKRWYPAFSGIFMKKVFSGAKLDIFLRKVLSNAILSLHLYSK